MLIIYIYYDFLSSCLFLNFILKDSLLNMCYAFCHEGCKGNHVLDCLGLDFSDHFRLVDSFINACFLENLVMTLNSFVGVKFLLKHLIKMLLIQNSLIHYQLVSLTLFYHYLVYLLFHHF